MMRNRLAHILAVTLAGITLLVIVVGFPTTASINEHYLESFIYGLLVFFAIIFSIPLSQGRLSLAHAIGMTAFLSLPREAFSIMTLMIALGSLAGSLTLVLRPRPFHSWQDRLYTLIYIVSRQTVSFFAAGSIYLALGGVVPIAPGFASNIVPITAFSLVYVALYLLIFALQTNYIQYGPYHMTRQNGLVIGMLIFMPIPFSILGGFLSRIHTSPALFIVTVTGAAMLIFGLYILSLRQLRLQRELHESRLLSAATDAIRGNLYLPDLLELAYQEVVKLLGVDYFTVALLDDNGDVSYPLIIEENAYKPHVLGDPPPPDHVLIQRVIVTGEPLILPHGVRHYMDMHKLPLPNVTISSWVGIPLRASGRSLGAFVIQSQGPRRFSQDDIRLIRILTTNASISVENAQVYQQQSYRAEQLAKLNMVTTTLTYSLSYDEVIETAMASAALITEADATALYAITNDGNYYLAEQRGLTSADQLPPVMTPPYGTGNAPRLLTVASLNTAPPAVQRILRDAHINALVELPLWVGNQQMGVLVLYYKMPQIFAYERRDLLQAYATQVAQALHNASTFASTDRALEQHIQQLSVLAELGQTLTAALKDARQVYETILSYIVDVTRAPHGAIIMKNEHGMLHVPAQHGYPKDFFSSVAILREGMIGQAMEKGFMVQCHDTHADDGCAPLLPDTRSILLVPIWRGSASVGLVLLESEKVEAFSKSDADFLQQVVQQGIIAIENTQLFQRVRQARDNMAVILNAMEEGILLLGADSTVMQANPRMTLLGLDSEDLIHRPIAHSMDNPDNNLITRLGFEDQAQIERLLQRLNDPAIWSQYDTHNYTLEDNEGIRHIQRQIIPVRDDQRQVVAALLVFYNKTEEYELGRQRQMFSRMLVHDLRSPLTAVTASLRLFQELIPEDSQYRSILEKAVDASQRAIRTVLMRADSLLDIAKMENGEVELDRDIASLPEIVDKVLTELMPLAVELNVEIQTNYRDDLPLLNIDGEKTERVIMNLMDNALKHSPTDSAIVVQARDVEDGYLRINIIDQGPGVPDSYKERLFEQFVQIEGQHGKRRGVGLGLTFCKLVIQAQGGRIWVEDNPQGGSTFSFTLPVAHIPEIIE